MFPRESLWTTPNHRQRQHRTSISCTPSPRERSSWHPRKQQQQQRRRRQRTVASPCTRLLWQPRPPPPPQGSEPSHVVNAGSQVTDQERRIGQNGVQVFTLKIPCTAKHRMLFVVKPCSHVTSAFFKNWRTQIKGTRNLRMNGP